VNSIAAPLYLSRGLVLTAMLYAAFWINAIVSWRNWHRLAAQAQQTPDATASSLPLSSESNRS
jgi:nicotinamide mononucleotide transporter